MLDKLANFGHVNYINLHNLPPKDSKRNNEKRCDNLKTDRFCLISIEVEEIFKLITHFRVRCVQVMVAQVEIDQEIADSPTVKGEELVKNLTNGL